MLSELYVPRETLPQCMAKAADIVRASGIPNIYGTIRMIEKDDETFLPWAKENYACVIFNLLVTNTELGQVKRGRHFSGADRRVDWSWRQLLLDVSQVGTKRTSACVLSADAGVL